MKCGLLFDIVIPLDHGLNSAAANPPIPNWKVVDEEVVRLIGRTSVHRFLPPEGGLQEVDWPHKTLWNFASLTANQKIRPLPCFAPVDFTFTNIQSSSFKNPLRSGSEPERMLIICKCCSFQVWWRTHRIRSSQPRSLSLIAARRWPLYG
jgi:hypothetical protein